MEGGLKQEQVRKRVALNTKHTPPCLQEILFNMCATN